MSMQVRVEALKQQLEQLFPGKWLSAHKRQRNLSTGLEAIDTGVTRGIARKRITEWSGSISSGKTTLLRSAIAHWCAEGLNVAYIDCEGKLYPADWASIGSGNNIGRHDGTDVVNVTEYRRLRSGANEVAAEPQTKGKFWIVRPEEKEAENSERIVPLVSKKNLFAQEAVWSADQFIRSNAFDVVILDLGSNDLSRRESLGMGYCPVPSRIYARLQRGLDKSKAALIIVSDTADALLDSNEAALKSAVQIKASNWGCHARFLFNRGLAIRCESGLNGVAMITPTIRLNAWRDGLSQEVEVSLGSFVPNRLFTHTQVPDRRTSKG